MTTTSTADTHAAFAAGSTGAATQPLIRTGFASTQHPWVVRELSRGTDGDGCWVDSIAQRFGPLPGTRCTSNLHWSPATLQPAQTAERPDRPHRYSDGSSQAEPKINLDHLPWRGCTLRTW